MHSKLRRHLNPVILSMLMVPLLEGCGGEDEKAAVSFTGRPPYTGADADADADVDVDDDVDDDPVLSSPVEGDYVLTEGGAVFDCGSDSQIESEFESLYTISDVRDGVLQLEYDVDGFAECDWTLEHENGGSLSCTWETEDYGWVDSSPGFILYESVVFTAQWTVIRDEPLYSTHGLLQIVKEIESTCQGLDCDRAAELVGVNRFPCNTTIFGDMSTG